MFRDQRPWVLGEMWGGKDEKKLYWSCRPRVLLRHTVSIEGNFTGAAGQESSYYTHTLSIEGNFLKVAAGQESSQDTQSVLKEALLELPAKSPLTTHSQYWRKLYWSCRPRVLLRHAVSIEGNFLKVAAGQESC